MKHVGFLAAVLFLSSFAFADSVDFQGAGSLAAGTAFTQGAIALGRTFEVGDELLQIFDFTRQRRETGNLGVIDVLTGTLFKCSVGFCFTGGELDIDRRNGTDLFLGPISSGSISRANGITILSAILPNGGLSVIRNDTQSTFSSQALLRTRNVLVPEPGTLGLLGTGFVAMGLLGWRRNKA